MYLAQNWKICGQPIIRCSVDSSSFGVNSFTHLNWWTWMVWYDALEKKKVWGNLKTKLNKSQIHMLQINMIVIKKLHPIPYVCNKCVAVMKIRSILCGFVILFLHFISIYCKSYICCTLFVRVIQLSKKKNNEPNQCNHFH